MPSSMERYDPSVFCNRPTVPAGFNVRAHCLVLSFCPSPDSARPRPLPKPAKQKATPPAPPGGRGFSYVVRDRPNQQLPPRPISHRTTVPPCCSNTAGRPTLAVPDRRAPSRGATRLPELHLRDVSGRYCGPCEEHLPDLWWGWRTPLYRLGIGDFGFWIVRA
jgi:hypothetical protein